MDANRFDSISKLFATRRSRRPAIVSGLGVAAATVLDAHAAAQDATPAATPAPHAHPNATETVTELFTQAFERGTWEPGDTTDTYRLTLTGTPAHTIYFSNRPERLFGLTPMAQFIATLDAEPSDPPNAALITGEADDIEILLIELVNPQYDADTSTLTYDAKVLTDYQQGGLSSAAIDQQDFDFPASFDQGGLFIDSFCGSTQVSCYHRDSNDFIGTTRQWNQLCYDSTECHTCVHERIICSGSFPVPCAQHANGWYPCYGKWAD